MVSAVFSIPTTNEEVDRELGAVGRLIKPRLAPTIDEGEVAFPSNAQVQGARQVA